MSENEKIGKNIKFSEKTLKRIEAMIAFGSLDGEKKPKSKMMSDIVENAVNYYFEENFKKELENL